MNLRPYQKEAIEACYKYLREKDGNPCIVIPTAGGKTPILSTICSDAVNLWDGRVLVLAHVKELLEQSARTLSVISGGLNVGVYSAGLNSRDTDNPVIVAGIQSVYKKACELGSFDLIIVDESHLISESSDTMYSRFFADAKAINPNVRIIGLTATPYRMSSGMICGPDNILNEICYEIGVKELIAKGYLCPLKSKAGKRKADTSGLHVRGGEFVANEVEELMDEATLVDSACREIVEQTQNRNSCLIFAASVTHAKHIQQKLKFLTGLDVGLVTGDTLATERAELLSRFKGNEVKADLFGAIKPSLKYLVNMNVLTTGFDAPNVDCVVLLRPTNSPGLYYQMLGRGFRLHPTKSDCLILDFGGNILRHGPVDALQIKDKQNGSGDAPAKECPECNSVIHAAYSRCPDCGYEFPPPDRGRHKSSAATAGVLSGEIEDTEYDVTDVYYSYHTKRNAGPDSLPTMRVEYQIGWQRYQSEWICFEHTGFARNKAVSWWKLRSNEPVPDTVDEAIEIANAGGLAETFKITVRSISGQKFDKIIDHELGPKPPLLDGSDERETDDMPGYVYDYDDEIPF